MYDCGKKLASWTSLLAFTTLLSACGGSDHDKFTDKAAVHNPDIIATNSSSAQVTSSNANTTQSSSVTKATSSAAVIQEKDSTPPSTTQLLLQQLSETSITLMWDDATDNAGISSYIIERNGQLIATLKYPAQVFADNNLQPGIAYTYTIKAVDYSGNDSKLSAPFTVRTTATKSSSQQSSAIIIVPPSNSGSTNTSNATSSVKISSAGASINNTSSKAASSLASVQSSNKTSSSSLQSSRQTSSLSTSATAMTSSSKTASSISSNASTAQSSSAPTKTDDAAQHNKGTINWVHPTQRENGNFLELNEIGGYEIRFKEQPMSNYTYVTLYGSSITSYAIDVIPHDSIVEIAVFDVNGIYSAFTPIPVIPTINIISH